MTEAKGLGSLGARLRAWPALGPAAAVGWVVYLISQANIVRLLGPARDRVVEMQTATSHAQLTALLTAWTPEELAGFAAHLPADVVHALIYPVVLAINLGWAFRYATVPTRFDPLLWLPFVAGGLDQVENVVHQLAVESVPVIPWWTWAAGLFASATKWAIAFAGVFGLGALVVVGTVHRRAPEAEAE